MKAMIFAAGLGTRLGEITRHTPKCLVQAGGKTLLEHVVERLKSAGVDSIIVNLHHLAESIVSHVNQRGSFGISIAFSHEDQLLGTGGGLLKARAFFEGEEDFFVHNADIYSEVNLKALLGAHRASKSVATLAVMKRETSRYLLFDDHDTLCGWSSVESKQDSAGRKIEKAARKELAFSGIQALSSKIFDYLSQKTGSFSIIEGYLAAVRAGQRVQAFDVTDDYWMDVGKPETLRALREKLNPNGKE